MRLQMSSENCRPCCLALNVIMAVDNEMVRDDKTRVIVPLLHHISTTDWLSLRSDFLVND